MKIAYICLTPMLFKKQILLASLCLAFFISPIKAQDGDLVPIANYEVSNLCYGGITSFSNTSTSLDNHVFIWTIWQMGNSVPIYTSSATDISFQFPIKTTYTVQLGVVNYVTPTHFHSDDATRTIIIDSIPIANFDFKRCHAKFSNLSCCTNTYLWDFGDGTPTSTLTSPVHSYTAFTNYTVTLIASNGVQSDTSTQVVLPYPNNLNSDFATVYDIDTVRFNSLYDSLLGTYCDWEWDFGDGSAIDTFGTGGWKVKHYYQPQERDSIYNVTLLLRDACYASEKQKTVLIKGIGKNVTSTYVFPSPIVFGYLNVESVEKENLIEMKIVDCLGKRLDNLTVWDKPYGYYIWIGDIAPGVYIVQLVFKDRLENHKVIKQ